MDLFDSRIQNKAYAPRADRMRARDTIPQNGVPVSVVKKMLHDIVEKNRYQIPSGAACARPITRVCAIARYAQTLMESTINPNLACRFMYDSVWDAVEKTEQMVLRLLDHPSPQNGGMLVMKSATQALTQALELVIMEYFARYRYDVRTGGLAAAPYKNIPKPVILAPVQANAALERAVEVLGLGTHSIRYYGLNTCYDTDIDSLKKTIAVIHSHNERIAACVSVCGDTERGIIQDNNAIASVIARHCFAYGYRPRLIVDAAAQWLTAARTKDARAWDFFNRAISMIVVDPQKCELPYDISMLLLRRYRDLEILAPSDTPKTLRGKERKQHLEAKANMLTSRGGAQVIALYAYLLSEGMQGLLKSRNRILGLTKTFAEYIRTSVYYSLIAEPETSVVAWTSKSARSGANWAIAKAINNGKDGCFIAYSPIMRVRTPSQRKRQLREQGFAYDGLHIHLMEHNTEKGLFRLCKRLEQEGRKYGSL